MKYMVRFLWWWNRGKVHGILPNGEFVLIANHSSYFDWLLLYDLVRRRFRHKPIFCAKMKVYLNPFWRMLVVRCRAVVTSEASKTAAIRNMLREMRETKDSVKPALIIFPEGTRTRNGTMNSSHQGAAWLARKLRIPIVPVALCGFWELWPPSNRFPTLRKVGLSIHVMDAINRQSFEGDQEVVDATMERIYETVLEERKKTASSVHRRAHEVAKRNTS